MPARARPRQRVPLGWAARGAGRAAAGARAGEEESGSGGQPSLAVALLELLAAPAPAGVVAADRLVGVDAALLDDLAGDGTVAVGLLVGVLARDRGARSGRGGRQRARLRVGAAGVRDRPALGLRAG